MLHTVILVGLQLPKPGFIPGKKEVKFKSQSVWVYMQLHRWQAHKLQCNLHCLVWEVAYACEPQQCYLLMLHSLIGTCSDQLSISCSWWVLLKYKTLAVRNRLPCECLLLIQLNASSSKLIIFGSIHDLQKKGNGEVLLLEGRIGE